MYVFGDAARKEPPVATLSVYVPTDNEEAVNKNVVPCVDAVGVVKAKATLLTVRAKSEKYAFVVPATVKVHAMATLVWMTGVVHTSVDAVVG